MLVKERASYGWQAKRRLSTVAPSAKVDVHQLRKSSQTARHTSRCARSVDRAGRPQARAALEQETPIARINLTISAKADPLAIANTVRQAVWSVDPIPTD
jgi:hypothetical protein